MPAPIPMNGPYVSETRFGVVMFGGVSLAIYMNGVAAELYHLARATPVRGQAPALGTSEVYAWLACLLADEALLQACREHLRAGAPLRGFFEQRAEALARAPRARLVIDVISGTSAGGINGVFLAKALANNEPFSMLKDLWIQEGDIAKLLNDAASREGEPDARERARRPASLLNSDRMYAQLLGAMTRMSEEAPRADESAPSDCLDELDLFVTTTDIRGTPVALRLFDRTVPERRYRQAFRFRYSGAEKRNDFGAAQRSFLAFAARCTSSFPVAFEPMTLQAIERGGGTIGDRDAWRRFFVATPGAGSEDSDPLQQAYGDGGYLDNKPFSYAIDALAQREAEVPVERKLIYIEPAPGKSLPRSDAERTGRPPDALSNALAALINLPRQETIREDLEAVLARNRLIERVEHIVGKGERDLDLGEEADPYLLAITRERDALKRFQDMKFDDMRHFYGDAFMPYRRLRVYLVTDKLGERLAALWQLDPQSDRLYALRALVRVWRDMTFNGDEVDGAPTFNAYLDQFDLRFRTRRLRFLLRRIDALHRLLTKCSGGALAEPETLSELHDLLRQRLLRADVDLRRLPLASFGVPMALQALAVLRHDFIAAMNAARAAERALPQLGGPEAPARRQRLGPMLATTLDLLLDTRPQGDEAQAAAQRIGLPGTVLAALDKFDKLPSATRTLQERVYQRARLVYVAMRDHEITPLEDALVADLKAMGERVRDLTKGTADQPALALVGLRLGEPEWEFPINERARPAVQPTGVMPLDTPEGALLRRLLASYYLRYDSYDQMALPLYYGTAVGEPAKVEVLRISPQDATSLIDENKDPQGRKKLAGTAFANFGGFMDAQWRRNDIMWGRFDGAERLLDTLLPQAEHAQVRAALLRQAQEIIATEELGVGEPTTVTQLVMSALDEAAKPDAGKTAQQTLLGALQVGDPTRRKQVQAALEGLFTPPGLLQFISQTRDVDRRLDPKSSLAQAARAVTVAGRLLEGIAARDDLKALPRWMSRGGLAAQALVAVSMPGRPWTLLMRHWLTMLYLLVGLVFGLGVLFSVPPMRSAALTAALLLAALHVVTVVLRDVMRERAPWKSRAAWVLVVLVFALAAVGAWSLHQLPPECLLPWKQCAVG